MPGKALARDEKVENLIMNFTMIMMGMFEGVFSALATGMASALVKTADAMTEAFDSEGATGKKKAAVPVPDTEAEVKAKVKEVLSGLRKEVAADFAKRGPSVKRLVSDPSFDAGIKIVEGHRLKLPMLTQRLTDEDLAGYVSLIQSGDPEVSKLLQELGEWQKTTPHLRD